MRRILLSVVFLIGCGGGDGDAPPPQDSGPDLGDPSQFAMPPTSCGFDCPDDGSCAEKKDGYACPALGAWDQIPHDTELCPAWDGKQPTPVAGKCTATAPTGEAAKYTGVDPDGTKILPDGRRVKPMGKEHAFVDPALTGGLPSVITQIPGKRWVITIDNGYGPHVVRSIDVDKIGTSDPVMGLVRFDQPKTLGSGLTFVAPDLLYVATSNGDVQAIKIDMTTGALANDDARTIKLPAGAKVATWHTSTVAASPDGKRLVVAPVLEKNLLVFDVEAGSPTFGMQTASIPLGANEAFGSAFDKNDPTGHHAYVTMWASRNVAEIDAFEGKLVRTLPTDKDPQGLAFLDARWMAVANSMGDTISLVDRVAGTSTPIPVDTDKTLHGFDPSSVAYDAANKRLYATLAGLNAVAAWDVDTTSTPPKITPAGRIPTGWWPGGVTTLDDGTVAIANMRANFDGPDEKKFEIHDGDVMGRTYGSVQAVPFPSAADLAAGEAAVKSAIDVGSLAGAPKVECPAGADYDFPIPRTNTEGPSKIIQHVIFVVRENKTFDALFGDLPGVNGKPEYILGKDKDQQERVWRNARALAQDFAHGDNYYTDAELSQQGHFWTVYGRSSDYNERTWPIDGYTRDIRHTPFPSGGVVDVGRTEEGSAFDWLGHHDIGYQIMGEALGLPPPSPGDNPIDSKYPGGFIQSIGYPDVEKACYVAGRARVLCDLRAFSYVTLPNDHTSGVSPKSPSPDSMIAMNDEATGLLVEGISKSPMWANTLIVITEDDPAVGGEHVDIHRTPLILVSPWVKRGYVTKTHIDVASLHKIFAHVFGLPYPNVQVAHASIPFDAFTSTPNYAPWDHKQRGWLLGCGEKSTAIEQMMTKSFDLDRVDESPGLDRQVERWMKGAQLQSLPPEIEAKIRAKIALKESGAAPEPEDDDDD